MRGGLGVGDKAASLFRQSITQGRRDGCQSARLGRSGEHVCDRLRRYGRGVSAASNCCVRSRLLN